MAMFVLAVSILGVVAYMALTRPCRSGYHRHRHLRHHYFRSW
jgi:hypothetical protein